MRKFITSILLTLVITGGAQPVGSLKGIHIDTSVSAPANFSRCDQTGISWVPSPGWAQPNALPDFAIGKYESITISNGGDYIKIFPSGSIDVGGSLMGLLKHWAECSLQSGRDQIQQSTKYFAAFDAMKFVDEKGRITNKKKFKAAVKKYRELLSINKQTSK